MTARQRAMLEKRSDGTDDALPVIPAEPLLSLPSGRSFSLMKENAQLPKLCMYVHMCVPWHVCDLYNMMYHIIYIRPYKISDHMLALRT